MPNLKVINEGIPILKRWREIQNLCLIKIMSKMFKTKVSVLVLAIVKFPISVRKYKIETKMNLLSSR